MSDNVQDAPFGTGSRPSDQAPAGLAASRFDPSRVEALIRDHVRFVADGNAIHVLGLDKAAIAIVEHFTPAGPVHDGIRHTQGCRGKAFCTCDTYELTDPKAGPKPKSGSRVKRFDKRKSSLRI